jgi:hypothetical protein
MELSLISIPDFAQVNFGLWEPAKNRNIPKVRCVHDTKIAATGRAESGENLP